LKELLQIQREILPKNVFLFVPNYLSLNSDHGQTKLKRDFNLLKNGCWYSEKDFVHFLKQPSKQLADKCTCGTIPFPQYRDFPVLAKQLAKGRGDVYLCQRIN
jgi:hypothetical protein